MPVQDQLVGKITAYQGDDTWLVSEDELATLGLKKDPDWLGATKDHIRMVSPRQQ